MKSAVIKKLCLVMAIVNSVAIFTGCGTIDKAVEATDIVTTEIEKSIGISNLEPYEGEDGKIHSEEIDFESIPVEFLDVDKSVYDTLPTINTITIDELYGFSIDQLRAFISLYAPNYREMYIIDEETEMTEEKWDLLRSVIGYDLFGTIRNPNVSDIEYEEDVYEKLQENALVKAQDYASDEEQLSNHEFVEQLEAEKNSIQEMSRDDFVAYVNDLFEQTGYVNDDGSAIDLNNMDNETLEEMKASMIKDIEDEISSLSGELEEDGSIQKQVADSNIY